MDIDLTASHSIAYYESQDQIPGGIDDKLYKTDHMLFRKIHAAGKSFDKGIAYGDRNVYKGWYYGARPSHRVSFTNDFYFAIYKATVRQMYLGAELSLEDAKRALMNDPVDECPYLTKGFVSMRGTPTAEHYDWPRHGHEVSSTSPFGKFRTFTGVEVDFPTDAQWEYACRAGESRLRYDGADDPQADGIGDLDWYSGNITDSSKPYYPVGAPKKPNAWGIYNLYGNGSEWILDKYVDNSSVDLSEIEPVGPVGEVSFDSAHVYRSGVKSSGLDFFSAYSEKYTGRSDEYAMSGTVRFCAPAIAK